MALLSIMDNRAQPLLPSFNIFRLLAVKNNCIIEIPFDCLDRDSTSSCFISSTSSGYSILPLRFSLWRRLLCFRKQVHGRHLCQPNSCELHTVSESFAILTAENRTQEKCTGWEYDLRENGYAVVKNAIPRDRAIKYQEKAYGWLKSFGTELDFNRPETWIKEDLPVQSKINTFNGYCVLHEKFMWDARMEPGVLETFAKIWGTDELLSSFDSLNITFPNRKDVTRMGAWEHIDQSPFRRGLTLHPRDHRSKSRRP